MARIEYPDDAAEFVKEGPLWAASENLTINGMPYRAKVRALTRDGARKKLIKAVFRNPTTSKHVRLAGL